jgi:predicted secreted protein
MFKILVKIIFINLLIILLISLIGCQSIPTIPATGMAPDPHFTPPWPNVSRYIDSDQIITVKVDEEFVIGLEAVIASGGQWREQHDKNMISFVEENDFNRQIGAKPTTADIWFLFKAVKQGKTRIVCIYKSRYSDHDSGKKVFNIVIE